jgi:hypothetical protein
MTLDELLRAGGLGALADPETRAAWGRSIARAPATIAGGPVDIANTVIGLLNHLGGGKSPITATEKPVLGSQWLAEHLGMPEQPGSPYADVGIGLAGVPLAKLFGRGAGAVEEAIASAKPGPVAGSPAAQAGAIAPGKAKAAGKTEVKQLTPAEQAESKTEAVRKVEEKNAALREDIPYEPPQGSQYWPWRVTHGGYAPIQDPKSGKWVATKTPSAGEQKLEGAMDDARKVLAQPGGDQPVWDLSKLIRPQQQNVALAYEGRAKGIPDWITEQYGPGFEEYVKRNALAATDPNAWKFYWTGQLQQDLHKALGPQAGQEAFQQLASNFGSTTSSARPPANVSMGSYFNARQAEGLPLPSAPPYPYGHIRTGTHLKTLQNLLDAGGEYLPPEVNPKGATFAGNISGQTAAPTMDQIMTEGHGLVNQAGKLQAAPFKGTYQAPVDAFQNIVAALRGDRGVPADVRAGLLPMDVQSAAWANIGGDPEYAKPLLQHISDRINITARVTGLPVQVVKDLWMRKEIPLLTTGGLVGLGLGGAGGAAVEEQ